MTLSYKNCVFSRDMKNTRGAEDYSSNDKLLTIGLALPIPETSGGRSMLGLGFSCQGGIITKDARPCRCKMTEGHDAVPYFTEKTGCFVNPSAGIAPPGCLNSCVSC